jgi:hypothetical protein
MNEMTESKPVNVNAPQVRELREEEIDFVAGGDAGKRRYLCSGGHCGVHDYENQICYEVS